ncbi:probable cation-transporting ATPase 13A3 [Ostrinia furnacalis]|uniref:probable cation-transporting ATPase 13A3 n=1 Tax=Ostrinia furnacalis TaxID=93504 RepID=UPI00103DDC68|nr:probable cation-transporting ATPase 13A3 [Ostrinia furnacalis]
MESEDDIVPLIEDVSNGNRDLFLGLNVQNINVDPEYEQVVYGYRKSRWRTVLVYFCSVLTCGIPFLLFHWCPTWFLYLTSTRSCFQLADQVLVVETYQKKHKDYFIHKILEKNIADTSGLLNEGFHDEEKGEKTTIESPDVLHTPVILDDGSSLNVQHYRYFRHKKQSLIWDSLRAHWARLAGLECGATCAQLQAMGARAPSSERRVRLLNIYGLNEIKVPVQSILTLILLEVFNPFYVFQLFTIAVWLAEPYYYYCIAVVLMSTFGVATSVIQTKKNQQNLRATVEAYDTVELWDGRTVDSRAVAPGDVIVIPRHGCTMHLDAVLLTGAAVLNESMLTGESVPVTKTALLRTDRPFDMKEHSSSILFCGTKVIQTRYYNNEPVRALVLRTGYNTSKGQLVRSILYPAPADFKFDRDSYKFIFILAVIALIGLAYTVALKAYRSLTPGDITLKALDIITIVIPPALPAAMTVGRLYAVTRLKRARVACLNTRAVNVSGSLDCICFDKTGTLTEDGLDMWGVVPSSTATQPAHLGRALRDPRALNDLHPLKIGMAACHSLTLLDAELAGDPLDLKMFESTGWTLEEPDVPESTNYEVLTPTIVKPKKTANINVDDVNMPLEVGIVQQHQFVSSLQRSSVVTRVLGEDVLRVFCKGAPEMLRTLCLPETGVQIPDSRRHNHQSSGHHHDRDSSRTAGGHDSRPAYRSLTPGDITLKALDIITIVIPPALPAAMTVGRLYAVTRLKRARVACLNTRAVNVSGSLDCICFDKTGTLTEDGLDMWGVVPSSTATQPAHLGRALRDPRALNDLHPLKIGMAACHSLTLLDAELAGDPLDLKMFESTGWTLEEPDVPESTNYEVLTPTIVKPKKTANINVDDVNMPLEVGIVQQHQFVSSLQRSSVVTRVLGEDVLRVFCKGAPEMLRTLCLPETVPDNLNEVLSSYAEKGYRVIALATRLMETTHKQLQKMHRDEVERELEFLGLVIMENRLKPATTGIIRELKEANIQVVMITGDNIHTAVSVARECGILASGERVVHLTHDLSGKTPVIYCESMLRGAPVGRKTALQRSWRSVDSGHGSWRGSASNSNSNSESLDVEASGREPQYKIVMSGDTWRVLRASYPHMVGRVAERGAVFARMTSDQKQQLILEYQALGYYVANVAMTSDQKQQLILEYQALGYYVGE